MKLLPLPDGTPEEHLGVSHTLKHYLRPSEMWEDVATEVVASARPRHTWSTLKAAGVPDGDARTATAVAEAGAWEPLRHAYRDGYLRILIRAVEDIQPPPRAPWMPSKDGRFEAMLPGAVLVVVQQAAEGLRLWSAWRPVDFKLTDYDCPPMDDQSVQLRRSIAALHARQRQIARARQGGR